MNQADQIKALEKRIRVCERALTNGHLTKTESRRYSARLEGLKRERDGLLADDPPGRNYRA